jgi:hypothetical protein
MHVLARPSTLICPEGLLQPPMNWRFAEVGLLSRGTSNILELTSRKLFSHWMSEHFHNISRNMSQTLVTIALEPSVSNGITPLVERILSQAPSDRSDELHRTLAGPQLANSESHFSATWAQHHRYCGTYRY